MISVKTGIRPEEVKFQRQHVLFVEGKDKQAIDPHVLNALFTRHIRIEPLGPSFSVRSVAEALFGYHPTYYFLIDRDHYDDAAVNRFWANFPDPGTHNLLMWKRREIENYFLDPEYLHHSKYCQASQDDVARQVLRLANERLFLDAANYVITSIREELKRKWITHFSDPAACASREIALRQLQQANEFKAHRQRVNRIISPAEIEHRYHHVLDQITGSRVQVEFGHGEWLAMLRGKKILTQVVNSSCFRVEDQSGRLLTGKEKLNEVVKDLLRKAPSIQPPDFLELKRLIEQRITGTP